MVIKILVTFAVFGAAPVCIGLLSARWNGDGGKSLLDIYLAGFLMLLAVFQLLAVPIVLNLPWGFPQLVAGYGTALAVLSVAGVLAGIPVIRILWSNGREKSVKLQALAGRKDGKGKLIETGIYWFLAGALILFQLYMAYAYAPFDGDDAYYVVQSVIADQTNVLYRILPYTGNSTLLDLRHALATLPLWEAFLARTTGIHAAIVAHSLLPLFLIPITYLFYFQIGRILLKDGRKLAVFMILASVLQIFGNTSIYTNATFFLMRTWQGKSLLCNLVLLADIWIMLHLLDSGSQEEVNKEDGKKHGKGGWWILLFMANVAAAMCTTMGAFLAAMFLGIVGLAAAIRTKQASFLIKTIVCCFPCLFYLALFVALI